MSSYHSCTFMMHVHVIGAFWKVTLIIRIHTRAVPSLSEEVFLLGPPSHSRLIHEVLNLAHPPLFIRPRTICALG